MPRSAGSPRPSTAGPQSRRQHHRQGLQQHRRAARPTTTSASARATRSDRSLHPPAVPRRAARHLRRRRRDQGLRRPGRIQDSFAAQRRADRALLPQRRRAHVTRGGRALQPRRQHRADDGARRHADRTAGRAGADPDEIDAMVAFMEALTDERVALPPRAVRSPADLRAERPPGDSSRVTDANGDGLADDLMIEIPAVGAAGGPRCPASSRVFVLRGRAMIGGGTQDGAFRLAHQLRPLDPDAAVHGGRHARNAVLVWLRLEVPRAGKARRLAVDLQQRATDVADREE